jgi:hypothetical protein
MAETGGLHGLLMESRHDLAAALEPGREVHEVDRGEPSYLTLGDIFA